MPDTTPTMLTEHQLTETLNALGINWVQEVGGPIVAPFQLDDDQKVAIRLSVEVDSEILVITARSSIAYAPDDAPLVIGLLNSWHAEHRWPTASFEVTGDEGAVIARFQAYLPAGATDDQLAGFVTAGIFTTTELFTWLAAKHRSVRTEIDETVTTAELEEWFRRAS